MLYGFGAGICSNMGSILALLVIILVSLLVVRLGTNALVLTGMSEHSAKFQAASAFFGVGFTTAEAEMVMRNVIRRRIVLHLIIAGNIGLTSAIATLIVTLVQGGVGLEFGIPQAIATIAIGAIMIAIILNVRWIKTPLDRLMMLTLRSAGVVRAMDYELLLNLEEGFCISEVKIEPGHPWASLRLAESRPSDHGIVVLNVRKSDGRFIGAPDKTYTIQVGDELMLYGASKAIDKVILISSAIY